MWNLRPRQKFSAPAPQRLEEHRIHIPARSAPECRDLYRFLNKQVVEYAVAVGLATNCTITQYCKFDRKNYFYPDNPQNYQISQLYLPICRNGSVEIETAGGKKSIGIHEIHMEEDAGKLVHDEWEDCSIVDYNRSGVPLIEIVSEPDMRSAEEVIAYLEKLRLIIQYLGASDWEQNYRDENLELIQRFERKTDRTVRRRMLFRPVSQMCTGLFPGGI